MESVSSKAVFLSYASQDAEAARRIAEALRPAGIEVWFDQAELRGGDAWDQKIRKQIQECALFVPVISAATQTRLEGYFRIEWNLAAQRTHAMAAARPFLLPVVIDATRDAEAHVPPEFKAVQWTRLPNGETAAVFVQRVQALLTCGLLAGTPDPLAGRGGFAEQKPGDRIGHYKLLEKIGEGGCGIVWRAEQEQPVHRRIALKVIKLGMDTKEVIGRFEAERQALALMDHLNIAKVFDAGTTDTGRPFFVMELVRGVPITHFCDEHNLPTAERLGLFIQVCHAIQHAHQKGIIHRDIKPSNILVALQDDAPVPKVIDFGIAKATGGRLSDRTVYTSVEQFIGTPAYMSPEQAEMSGLDVDTRSDIYSLGVLLYELLTGRLPFDPRTLPETGLDEIRRIIREVEPARPSTRLRSLPSADLTTAARQRDTGPAQLSTQLRGDLDWIVMKSLEKQRNRRYESAAAFAADIMRHLHDEPVTARPPSAIYRSRKFVARHRVAAGAAAMVACALLAGAVISTWQAVRARAAEQTANRERTKAVEARTRADDLLDFMLGDLRTEVHKVGKLDLLEKVSDKAMAYFASLDPRDLTDTTLSRQAKALTQIGDIRLKQGRHGEAIQAFSTSYERAAALAARHPSDARMLFERGQAEFGVGMMHRTQGALGPAKEWFTRYRDTGMALLQLNPASQEAQSEVAAGLHNLAALKVDLGDLRGARADFTAKLAMIQEMSTARPDDLELRSRVADTISWLGKAAERNGELAEAAARFREQVKQIETIVEHDPPTRRWRQRLGYALGLHADVLSVSGQRPTALGLRKREHVIFDELAAQDPENREWTIAATNALLREAILLQAENDARAARTRIESVRLVLEPLVDAGDLDLTPSILLAIALRVEAQLLLASDRSRAADAASRALRLSLTVVKRNSANEAGWGEYAKACLVAGALSQINGDDQAARLHWQTGLDSVLARARESKNWRILDPTARLLACLGRPVESHELIHRLDGFGYRPVEPWPSADVAPTSFGNTTNNTRKKSENP